MFKFILVFLLLSQAVLGTTRYIATTGHDTNNTCAESISVSTPKRNFQGTDGALACMAAGDTLIVKAGTYTETDIGLAAPGQLPSGISDSQRTILMAAPGETVIIQPSGGTGGLFVYGRNYITIDGIIFDNTSASGTCLYIGRAAIANTPSTYITAQNCTFRNCNGSAAASGVHTGVNQDTLATTTGTRIINCIGHNNGGDAHGHGVYAVGRNVVIDGGEWYSNTGHGIHHYCHGSEQGAWDGCSGSISSNNKVYNNGNSGIGLYNGNGLKAYNNILYGNGANQIAIRYGCYNCEVNNNTVYSGSANGIFIDTLGDGPNTTKNNIVRNNIIHSNAGTNYSNGGINTSQDHNLCSTGCWANEANAANIFTNPGTFDLTLKANSPAIGNGTDLSSSFTTDYAGITRSNPWDIGAYEYVSLVESITLNTPNGGESWLKTGLHTITWSKNNFTNTRLRADRNNDGTFEETINASTSASSLNWTPGGTASTTVKLEVCDAADGTPCDVSNAVFTIADTAGTTVTRIISENTIGSFIGDVNGVEDVALWSDTPTTNFADASININKTATVTNNTLLRFTGLSQIPSNATVTSVTLGLNLQAQAGGGTGIFDVRKSLRPWNESQASWNIYSTGNNWTTAGGTGAGTDRRATAVGQFTGVGATLQFYTVTDSVGAAGGLLDLVREWVSGSDINNGFHNERNGSGADGRLWTWTSSEGTNGNRPYLSVTYSTSTSTISVVEPFSDSHFFPGQIVPIRWGSQGVSGNVEVLLSRDGGINYMETLAASYPFDGSDFPWLVTVGSCSACTIKVVSLNDPTVFGISAPFRIAGNRLRAR